MWRYIVKRLLWLIIIIICVALLIFTILFFVPGDPAQIMLGNSATYADIQNLRAQLGLDKPFVVQLAKYLYDTFIRFDLGTSYVLKTPIITDFAHRLPRTLLLSTLTIIVIVVCGIPIGITAALHRNSLRDQGLLISSMVFVSMPQFWFALLMVILFSKILGWLPPYGIGDWKCWIMPVVANAVAGLAQVARQTRAAVLETIKSDFVTTARAKGVPERKVIYRHMLPNALNPVIDSLGHHLASAVAGTVVIESVFSFPGIGQFMLNGINNRDYPVVRACVLMIALCSAFVMLLIDLFYAYLDPRIKAQYVNMAAKKRKLKG